MWTLLYIFRCRQSDFWAPCRGLCRHGSHFADQKAASAASVTSGTGNPQTRILNEFPCHRSGLMRHTYPYRHRWTMLPYWCCNDTIPARRWSNDRQATRIFLPSCSLPLRRDHHHQPEYWHEMPAPQNAGSVEPQEGSKGAAYGFLSAANCTLDFSCRRKT